MSKRRGQDNMSKGHGKRSRPEPKKHLYLVLDDWEKGYSIRKIDPDTMLSYDDYYAYADQDLAEDLPEPAAFRFVAPALRTRFLAMGSNIIAVSSGGDTGSPTLVYDTAAAALATGPPLPGHLAGPIIPVADGDALYALTTLGSGMPPALEAFSWAPCTRDTDSPWPPSRMHEWSWKSVAAPQPPFFPGRDVVAYAAHPYGRHIFVSTREAAAIGGGGGGVDTYSFDTERREWTPHGAWALPFRGQGHFDHELDVWVGLDEEPGFVCACQVASRTKYTELPPESDRMEERLFYDGDESTGSKPTLTYMGDSKFCLVESVARDDVEELVHGREVCVTTFGLKFDRKGKLKTTSQKKFSSYIAPKYMPFFSPLAFWM